MDNTKQKQTIEAVVAQLRDEGYVVECEFGRTGFLKVQITDKVYKIPYAWRQMTGGRCELQINGGRGSNYSKKLRFRPVFSPDAAPSIQALSGKFQKVANNMWESDSRKAINKAMQDDLAARLSKFKPIDGVLINNDHETVLIEIRSLEALRPIIDYLVDNNVEWFKGTGMALVELELDADDLHLEDILKTLSR